MIGVIIQARSGSKRFPRKIYEPLNGKNTLYRVLEEVKKASLPHKIILAMPEYDAQEFINMFASVFAEATDDRFKMYFGDPDDLLDRYYRAALENGIDLIVRVTADCPLVQGKIIDEMLCEYLKNGYNGFMGSNETVSDVPYPDGTDVEVFPYWMLVEAHQLTQDPVHREHVAPFMYRRGTEYKLYGFKNQRPNTQISMKFSNFSFDTQEDFRLLEELTKEYDKHGDLNKAIHDTNFQIREWKGIK